MLILVVDRRDASCATYRAALARPLRIGLEERPNGLCKLARVGVIHAVRCSINDNQPAIRQEVGNLLSSVARDYKVTRTPYDERRCGDVGKLVRDSMIDHAAERRNVTDDAAAEVIAHSNPDNRPPLEKRSNKEEKHFRGDRTRFWIEWAPAKPVCGFGSGSSEQTRRESRIPMNSQ